MDVLFALLFGLATGAGLMYWLSRKRKLDDDEPQKVSRVDMLRLDILEERLSKLEKKK